MNKWNLVIDVALCENCNCCLLACKDEFVGNSFEGYSEEQPRHGQRWINIMTNERGNGSLVDVAYLPIYCMHCENPACMEKSKNGSVYQRDDGIVIIDPVKAKGNRALVNACPYGVIWWNDILEIPQKCTFCAHLLDDGHREPRCVQACPTGALKVFQIKESEMQALSTKDNLERLHPEFGTKPRVRYKNLYRYSECFIAGSVSYLDNAVKECAANAKVRLFNTETLVAETQTDFFGDFKFDKVPPESGQYKIEIQFQDNSKIVQVEVGESVYLEEIMLS